VTTTPISYLICIAEQKKQQARDAFDLGVPDAQAEYREWSIMLDTLRKLSTNGLLDLVRAAAT